MTPFQHANGQIGVKEIPGSEHNQSVVNYFAEVGHGWVGDDETAWCAAFVGAMLARAGLPHTGKLNARSYLNWGEIVDLKDARPGDLVIFSRGGRQSWQGHVGFYCGHDAQHVETLGGNQKNSVNVSRYSRARLLAVRRMPGLQAPRSLPKPDGLFVALLNRIFGFLNKGGPA